MRIKYFVLLLMALLAIISSMVFTVVIYETQSKALLKGLDDKLFAAAYFTRGLVGEDFHDTIADEGSVSKDDYLKIVDSYNKLCAKLGLEYVWSLLLIDGKTVFTTGTSTSKDVSKGDHALFFEEHSNPELYTETFRTMEAQYQISDDKWGRIRVVLVPFKDSHGRPYLFGASIKTTEVDALVRRTLVKSSLIGGMIIIAGVFFSFLAARQLSKPIEEVTEIAKQIAGGRLDRKAEVQGCFETKSLSSSINAMSESINNQMNQLRESEEELRASNQQLEAGEQQLRASNQQLVAGEQQLRASNQQLVAGEQQLRASNQQLEAKEKDQIRLLKALSFKNKELKSIVYISSHDLRSPLVNIEGFSGELSKNCETFLQLAGKRDDPSSQQQMEKILKHEIPESLGFITSSVTKMKMLLDGLLRVSRAGMSEVNISTINMNDLLGEVRGAIEFQIQEKEATFTVGDLPGCVGDAELLNQVFTNLVDNALKYRSPSGKTVIEISGKVNDGEAVYCVKDNGMGIDKDHQKNIFEIFHRLNPNDDVDGEGLGLTIVSRVVDRLDGKIRVESEVGKGSEFYIALPRG